MTSEGIHRDKKRYWEAKLWELLNPIDIKKLIIMSWALEAVRSDRADFAKPYLDFPQPASDHKIKGIFFIPPWNVDALLNEKLTLGLNKKSGKELNLNAWGAVAKLLNTYSGLDNIDSHTDIEPGGIISAMPRMFWPQYDWQLGFDNATRLGRAWFVYATPAGKAIFKKKYEVELEEFLKVAFFIYGAVLRNPAVRLKLLEEAGLKRFDIIKSVYIIGSSLAGQAQHAAEIRADDLPRSFKRSALKERPIFIDGNVFSEVAFIPSRDMLLKRISDGLYYDIVHDADARRASGEYFEELCYLILKHYSSDDDSVSRERKTPYGKSADMFWMNSNENSGVIVECKIRRLPHRVLTSPKPWVDCQEDFDDIVKGVVQVWRTHHSIFSKSEDKITGLVWQYESWTLMGNSFINRLFVMANAKADRLNIPESSRVPVALVGHPDLERCLKSYNRETIMKGIDLSMSEKFHGFMLHSIIETFAEQNLLSENFDYATIAGDSVSWWNDL